MFPTKPSLPIKMPQPKMPPVITPPPKPNISNVQSVSQPKLGHPLPKPSMFKAKTIKAPSGSAMPKEKAPTTSKLPSPLGAPRVPRTPRAPRPYTMPVVRPEPDLGEQKVPLTFRPGVEKYLQET